MDNLLPDSFSPKEAELQLMVEKYKGLEIKGVDDADGLKIVHTARMELRDTRVKITKEGKALRQDAVDFQKAVISREKELVAMIEPLELELQAKEDAIAKELERIERQGVLPLRREKLESIGLNSFFTDQALLDMDEAHFAAMILEEQTKVKYQQFLVDNGYDESKKDDFIIQRNNKTVVLFKKVAEITI